MRLVGDNSLVKSVSSGWCDEGRLLVYAWCVVRQGRQGKFNFLSSSSQGARGNPSTIHAFPSTNLGNAHWRMDQSGNHLFGARTAFQEDKPLPL